MPSEVGRRLLRHRHFAVHRFEPDDTRIGMKSDEKDPNWCDHAGVSYASIPHGRGGLGDGKRPAFFSLSPAIF
jgi:hypothetical protein